MKRIIALSLALLMIIALVGCGSKKRQIIEITLSSEDSAKILAAAGIKLPDPATTPGAGTTIKWFSHYDPFHNYDEDEIVNTGFFTLKEMYGCEVEHIETTWGERFNDLAANVLGGTPPDIMEGETSLFPMKVLNGMIQPVDPYIDYDDPLFSDLKEYVDAYFTIGGHNYFMLYDVSFDTCVPYNKRVMNDYGYEDPAELFYNNEWTWDKYEEMCLDFNDPDNDRYALDGWAMGRCIMESTGVPLIGYDTETSRFYSNIDDPRLERAADLLYDLQKNETCYPWWTNWSIRNGTEGSGMKEGLCLFYPIGTWSFTGPVDTVSAVWGDIEGGELMFVPVPRDPNGDGQYYLRVRPGAYCIVKDCDNPDGAALLAKCERFKRIDPTVTDIDEYQLINTYKWTKDMLDMYDTCDALANTGVGNLIMVYGDDDNAGYGADIGSRLRLFLDDIGHPTSLAGASTWAQVKASYQETMEYYIGELNAKLDKFESNGGVAEPKEGNN